MDSDDRRFIVANTLICQGATAEFADCVVRDSAAEFGDEFFEREPRVLTADEQARLEQVQIGCIDSDA
jgi:hypothetical protein